jgi:succinate-semialdehyde dehydrogenase/glutarate-semialdehyde dehydrogenase
MGGERATARQRRPRAEERRTGRTVVALTAAPGLYRTVNPTSGEPVVSYPTAREDEIERALARAVGAFAVWRATPLEHRARLLARAADLLDAATEEIAALMALEMGKPMAEGRAEAGKCAWGCRYYAEQAAAFLADEDRPSDGSRAVVRSDPLGPILAIMPWNFPFWQFFRFAAPALAAGNVVLLKHAPNTPGCARRIERLLRDAEPPAEIVQNLFLDNEQAARVLADPRVAGVTLTGSTRAGRDVAAVAGRQLKPMVMELGGSDAFIVFEDAALERAVEVGVASRCLNNGQSCIAAKRFLVQAAVFDRFHDAFAERMQARTMGDPTDPAVQLGPLARHDLRDRLARQVEGSVAGGARVSCGGRAPGRTGFFYPPTVLVEAPPGTPAAEEELFGPVATLWRFDGEDEALARANGTPYGLAASLWTADPARVARLVPRLEAGSVFVNGLVKSDPRLPFGGIKQSGFGRELGREGLLEFVNRKVLWIA